MNPQPKPQKLDEPTTKTTKRKKKEKEKEKETHEARMKENETHHYALVNEAFLGTKGYVGRVLCLLVGSPIHLQRLHQLRRCHRTRARYQKRL